MPLSGVTPDEHATTGDGNMQPNTVQSADITVVPAMQSGNTVPTLPTYTVEVADVTDSRLGLHRPDHMEWTDSGALRLVYADDLDAVMAALCFG